MRKLALATAIAAYPLDDDLPLLLAACGEAGIDAQVLAWDDPTVSWSRFDAVLLRSTWDYIDRLPGFLAWCDRVAAATRLLNPPDVVRWNTDKRYLGDLARAGVAVIDSHFIAPGDEPSSLPAFDVAFFASYPRLRVFLLTVRGIGVLVGFALLSAKVSRFWALDSSVLVTTPKIRIWFISKGKPW